MKATRRILSLFLPLLLAACGGDIEPGLRTPERSAVSGLTLAPVTESRIPEVEVYVGTIASRDRGVVAARTDGIVARLAVRAGTAVKAGDLLLTISQNQAGDRLRAAEAGSTEARGHLAAARARNELARKTFERYQLLFQKEAVTPQEMDRVTAELEESRQQVAAAEAAVAGAESGRAAAGTNLAYGRVTAPYAARIVRLEVEEGSTVLPGTPLLVLDRAEGWEVRAEIPESRTGKVALGDPVQVEVPALGTRFSARLAEIEPAADPRSRSFRAKATLPPEAKLAAGLFARVSFPGGERSALLVPVTALVERGQLTGIYVVRDDVLHYRLVRTGRQLDGLVEILSGLQAGETVVIGGVERARSGARVEG